MTISPFDYSNIRPDIRRSLDAWGTGERPFLGWFLLAVMANDLMQAIGRADADNLRALPAIVSYIRNELPGHCHGSYDICDVGRPSTLERSKMSDLTPPRPQDATPGDYDEPLWEAVLADEPRCAECGEVLFPHEVKRQPDVAGSKFAEICNECMYLKLGLR